MQVHSETGAPSDAELLDALDEVVARAAHSALYAERLRGVRIRSLEDLARLPLTTRLDLQRAGPEGTRAAPREEVCHYGETSGTSGASNSTWLVAEDFECNARAIAARHPETFGPGRMILNRFPFMAAPAHLVQRVAQRGGGVSIPAGNINWDVPFTRALELARRTGAQVLAGMPLEPVILGEVARGQGLDPAKTTSFDTFFLGGAPLPPAMQRRMEKVWGARVIELYGSTETMLLGTGCALGRLHLETGLFHGEYLATDSDEPAREGAEARFVVTTTSLRGSPLVRYETGDLVRRLPPCECGDPRPAIVVVGRASDAVEIGGRRLHAFDVTDAAAAAADALDSSVFFVVALPDRLLLRIESEAGRGDPEAAWRERLGDVPVEIERVGPNELLDVEVLARSPSVYKPVVLSDWRGSGRRVLSVSEGMIEWPRPSAAELWRWLRRGMRRSGRRRRLARGLPVAPPPGR